MSESSGHRDILSSPRGGGPGGAINFISVRNGVGYGAILTIEYVSTNHQFFGVIESSLSIDMRWQC
jgi:hypothetical protein